MSKIEVDTIAPQSGTSLTIGESGDTVTIPSGATFDTSNATVNSPAFWQSPQSTSFSALASKGYFVDTSGGTLTATLPASPSTGDEVTFVDQTYSFNTNALTIGRNGSNIANSASDLVINTQGAGFTLVYSGDATVGWTYKDK